MNDDPQLAASGPPDPQPGLSSADESFVSGLLAGLPDPSMPPQVAARIDAALAELGPLPAPAGQGGAPTVVPFAAPRRPAAGWRSPRVLQVAAALVLVVGAGVVGVKAISGGTTSTPSASSASATAVGAIVTMSNRAYSSTSLVPEVRSLVAASPARAASAGQVSSAAVPGAVSAPSAAGAPAASAAPAGAGPLDPALRTLTSSTTALAPCIAAIEDGLTSYVAPIAIDAGSYDGKPALIVVLPGANNPDAYDVWVVGPTCGANKDAALISYQSVARG